MFISGSPGPEFNQNSNISPTDKAPDVHDVPSPLAIDAHDVPTFTTSQRPTAHLTTKLWTYETFF